MSGWSDPVRIFLIRTYQRENPDKIKDIPGILRKYEDQRLFLVQNVIKKYKVKKTHLSIALKRWIAEQENAQKSTKKRGPKKSKLAREESLSRRKKWDGLDRQSSKKKKKLFRLSSGRKSKSLPLKNKEKKKTFDSSKKVAKKEETKDEREEGKEEEVEGLPKIQVQSASDVASPRASLSLSMRSQSLKSEEITLKPATMRRAATEGHTLQSYGSPDADTPFNAEEIMNVDPLTLLQRSTGALASMNHLLSAFQESHPDELRDALEHVSRSRDLQTGKDSRSHSLDSDEILNDFFSDSEDKNLIPCSSDTPNEAASPLPAFSNKSASRGKNIQKPPLSSIPSIDVDHDEMIPTSTETNKEGTDSSKSTDSISSIRKMPKLTTFDSVSNLLQEECQLSRRETLVLIKKYESSKADFAPLLRQEMEEDPTMWLLSWSAQESLQTPADVAAMLKHLERSIMMIETYIPTCNDLLRDDEATKTYLTAVIQELLKRAQQKHLLKGVQQDWSLWAGADFEKMQGIVAEDIDRMIRYMAWVRNNIRASNVTDYNDARQACQGAHEIKDALKMILEKQLKHESTRENPLVADKVDI